ncbi:MAG TPA: DUF2085 domain-containing protein [Candidatus Dorea gallistercoris]|uniref:DUF2085 domain-containing protein n=1 Tax=Candidatus Dorea gallistercoris TaxID=2838542 RepID=A0A9D1RCU4_9FIRM|nr:DUF2085 domain-containing protein [Candidatus Dorea gallistercoris]
MEWCKKYCRCHQMPERSFFLKGYQLPLCARCTGIALGHIAAFLAAPFHTFRLSIAILMLPLAVDGTIQHFTAYRSNNFRRIVTGCLYGFAFMSVMLHGLKALPRRRRK